MELTLSQLVKIIIGVLVFAIVVIGVYFFFKTYVFGFFGTGNNNGTGGAILALIKNV